MPDTSNSLLDFILDLLSDHQAAGAFYADPDGALKDAGLAGVCGSDVDAVLPLILDYAPVTLNTSSFDRTYDTGSHESSHSDGGNANHAPKPDHLGKPHHDGKHDDNHDGAVQQIHTILNNYTYSSVDDRDTIVDQSVNQNIWAKGDVKQSFDNDSVIASGDGAIAAGDDVDDAITGNDNVVGDGNVTGNGDGNVTGDDNVVDNSSNTATNSFNEVDGDGNAVGEGTTVDNTDNSVEVEVEDSFNDYSTNDSFNEDNDGVDDSFNGNDLSDNSTNDSYNDNSDNSDNSINDSGNTDVDVEVEIEKSFNEESDDDFIDVDDSLNDNEVDVH